MTHLSDKWLCRCLQNARLGFLGSRGKVYGQALQCVQPLLWRPDCLPQEAGALGGEVQAGEAALTPAAAEAAALGARLAEADAGVRAAAEERAAEAEVQSLPYSV